MVQVEFGVTLAISGNCWQDEVLVWYRYVIVEDLDTCANENSKSNKIDI